MEKKKGKKSDLRIDLFWEGCSILRSFSSASVVLAV
jgi:hypothetical protein